MINRGAARKKARRELARALDLSDLVQHHDRFLRLLDRFWIAEDSGLSFEELEGLLVNGTRPVTLRDRIERHVFRNPRDGSPGGEPGAASHKAGQSPHGRTPCAAGPD
jgi:hypothetical protein